MRLGFTDEEIFASCKIDPWFLARCATSSRWKPKVAKPRPAADALRMRTPEGHGLLGRAPRACSPKQDRGRRQGAAPRARRAPGVQAHRHLRGRVRLADRLHVLDLRDAVRRHASPTKRSRRTRRRSSFSAAARTASARASSSTTAAATPASRCATPATKPSWSTAIRRPCRPTTTPRIASISSRSPPKTCSRSSTPSAPTARCTA